MDPGVIPVAMNLSNLETTSSEYDLALTRSRESEIARLNQISSDIKNSYIWVVFALGFPGNIFSIITILTMQIVTPATFLVSALAFCDGCTLAIKLIGHQLVLHKVFLGSVGCKSFFLPSFLATLANWILVMICFERFVSVCFPLRKAYLITKRRTYISLAILASLFFSIFSVLFVIMSAATETGLQCGVHKKYFHFWTTGWYWINTFLYLLVPFPCIVILTALIIRGLALSRRDRRCILRNGSDNQDNNRRLVQESERLERTITFMLIFTSVIFLVMTLPACVSILSKPWSQDPLTLAKWELFEQIQYVITDSSHAVNFFLYFFSARRFRHQFFYLLTCKRWPRKIQKARSTKTSTYLTRYTIARSNEDVSQI